MKKMEKAVITKEDLLEFLNYNELSAKEKKKYRDLDFEKLLEFADHDLIEVLETCDITKDPRFKIEETKQIEAGIGKKVQAKNFKCGTCEKIFQLKTNLARHEKFYQERCAYWTARKKRDQPFVCDQCGKQYKSKFEVSQHVKSHRELKFRCCVCLLKFKSRPDLNAHKKCHSELKFKFKFTRKNYLFQHEVMIPCIYCREEFPFKTKLWEHYSSAHKDKRPFACGKCGMNYKHHHALIFHQKKHH
jgi:hypothetical protein